MPTKSLKVLVVDGRHSQRLSIEKMLNQHGYHRIAPLASFSELLVIIEHTDEPFDLLLVNSAMVDSSRFDLEEYCRKSPGLRHAIIYDGRAAEEIDVGVIPSRVIKRFSRPPDGMAIESFMQLIDPARAKQEDPLSSKRGQ